MLHKTGAPFVCTGFAYICALATSVYQLETVCALHCHLLLLSILLLVLSLLQLCYPSVTRSATKVQLNLKLGFFSRRLWTWDKCQTKSATVRPQICNYSATYKPLLFFQREGPWVIAPRVTGLVSLAGTSRDGPIQFSCIFVAREGENFLSRDKTKSTAATSLWLKNGIFRSVSVTCRDMQGRAKTHPRPSWLVSRLSWLVPSSWALATSRSCDRGVMI